MMGEEIFSGVYLVGSPELTAPEDACVYLVEFPRELVLIDAGAGNSVDKIIQNIKALGLAPEKITKLILTHCHIDHSGGAGEFKRILNLTLFAHQLCGEILAQADPVKTAGLWYGIEPEPVKIDQSFSSETLELDFGVEKLVLVHIPGHSPGSIAVYLDRDGKRILFGQDVHGPLHPALGSDPKLYQESLKKLLSLKADILCEGHFGIYQPAEQVEKYIRSFLA